MPKLSETELTRIEAAVAEAETTTSAEIVCVIAKHSEDFRSIGLGWAAFLSLAVPWILLVLTSWPVTALLFAQLVAFLLLALLLTQTQAFLWFVPRSWAHREAAQAAREQFFIHGIHRSSDRQGVMLYVSLAEHYAEVLVDVGLEDKVPQSVWQEAHATLIACAKEGRLADGIIGAVNICAPALALVAPPGENGNGNERPNRPIII